jgi:hypothetical protein
MFCTVWGDVMVLNDDFRRSKPCGLLKGIARRNVTTVQSIECSGLAADVLFSISRILLRLLVLMA